MKLHDAKAAIPGGCLISFEGIDGCGKSVQAAALTEKLRTDGCRAHLVREPGGTEVSEKIRSVILDRNHLEMTPGAELFLYEAARAQLMNELLLPLLAEGHIIVCDRFTDSTAAYQGYGRGLSAAFIAEANRFACSGRFPDCTFLLDISWEESLRRRAGDSRTADRMEMEQKAFYSRVKTGYAQIARAEPERVCVLDGSRSITELKSEIYSITLKKLDRLRGVTHETE